MTAYIIDTETTHAEVEQAEVIELACYELMRLGLFNAIATINQHYKPHNSVSWGALATHHILPGDLDDCSPSSTAALPADASHIIGHNVDFDWRVLGSPPVKRICTLAMARSVWPELDSHKLGALVYFIMGPVANTKAYLLGAHSAGADVFYCNTVLNAILDTRPDIQTVDELWEFSEFCRIPTIMSFGKYKGRPVAEVDRGWITWYRKQQDKDPYLLEAFERLGR